MSKSPTVCAIVAVGPRNVIGYGDAMPWHSRQDFYHFRKLTMGYPCIFGRRTYNGLPTRPLPGRLNIICSSKYNDVYVSSDVFHASCIENALSKCCEYDRVFICGGATIYKYALSHDLIDVVYLTRIFDSNLLRSVQLNPAAYTFFPIDIDCFFTPDRWVSEQINYPPHVMPSEKSNISAMFYKYTRIR